mmetsp:Transcript_2283/g.3238  ORF Transcript_2283/g.3238 Transcript_2283/m.3238 type:complete len:283 (-) Transcript_2283:111-959(-)
MIFQNDVEHYISNLTKNYDKNELLLVIQTTLASLLVAMLVHHDRAFNILKTFVHEFLGMSLMVCCVFLPGPLFGHTWIYEWTLHALAIIASDRIAGGPLVNPAVSHAMMWWRKLSIFECASLIGAQLLGAIVGYPITEMLVKFLRPSAFVGGPEFDLNMVTPIDAFANEFAAFALLLCAIFGFCCTSLNHWYYLRQSLLALSIRFIVVLYPRTGPAMNPALGTVWVFYSVGHLPSDLVHYTTYWMAPFLSGVFVTLLWSAATKSGIFSGGLDGTGTHKAKTE